MAGFCLGTLQPTVAGIRGELVSEGSHVRCAAGGAAGKREGPLDTSSLYPADPGGCHRQLSGHSGD